MVEFKITKIEGQNCIVFKYNRPALNFADYKLKISLKRFLKRAQVFLDEITNLAKGPTTPTIVVKAKAILDLWMHIYNKLHCPEEDKIELELRYRDFLFRVCKFISVRDFNTYLDKTLEYIEKVIKIIDDIEVNRVPIFYNHKNKADIKDVLLEFRVKILELKNSFNSQKEDLLKVSELPALPGPPTVPSTVIPSTSTPEVPSLSDPAALVGIQYTLNRADILNAISNWALVLVPEIDIIIALVENFLRTLTATPTIKFYRKKQEGRIHSFVLVHKVTEGLLKIFVKPNVQIHEGNQNPIVKAQVRSGAFKVIKKGGYLLELSLSEGKIKSIQPIVYFTRSTTIGFVPASYADKIASIFSSGISVKDEGFNIVEFEDDRATKRMLCYMLDAGTDISDFQSTTQFKTMTSEQHKQAILSYIQSLTYILKTKRKVPSDLKSENTGILFSKNGEVKMTPFDCYSFTTTFSPYKGKQLAFVFNLYFNLQKKKLNEDEKNMVRKQFAFEIIQYLGEYFFSTRVYSACHSAPSISLHELQSHPFGNLLQEIVASNGLDSDDFLLYMMAFSEKYLSKRTRFKSIRADFILDTSPVKLAILELSESLESLFV